MTGKDLTKLEILRAASNSKNKAVLKAYDKLKFAIVLAHTEEEIEELAGDDIYHLRISQRNPEGDEYQNIMIRWTEDEFVIYAPHEGSPIAGKGHKLDRDPAIVYLKNKASITESIKEEIKQAGKAFYGRLGRK